MGVNGLWQVLQPCARPTNLATLNRKRLAVDASIWIYQFLKAVRDKEGNALRNSHVVGFFRRICKLLWFGIRPVFVFDGGAPVLKRATLQARRHRREGRRDDAVRTAGKLLAVQMQRLAEEEQERERERRRGRDAGADADADGVVAGEALPSMDQMVYAEEAHMAPQERLKNRKFTKQDAYHLPDLDEHGIAGGNGRPEDPRIMSIDELEEYARQFHAGEDINLYDFSKIDFDGDFFQSLPSVDRYNILNAARIRSRLRMGLSKEQLDTMFPDRMAFSRFQIERVRERNHLTQRLMVEVGMTGIDLTMNTNGGGGGGVGGVNARVAGEKDREYILVKNEGAEGGWALGVVSRDKDRGETMQKPIDVDALQQFRYPGDHDEDGDGDADAGSDDVEFEDVPIEGLNRLPKRPAAATSHAATDELGDRADDVDDDSLFVSSYPGYEPADNVPADGHLADDAGGSLSADENEDLHRAIAMSLQTQHGIDSTVATADEREEGGGEEEEEGDAVLEDVPAPQWTQRAAEAPRPIFGSSGQMVAHVVNNRSSAAVAATAKAAAVSAASAAVNTTGRGKKESDEDSSDSELDIRAAMNKAAKKKKPVPVGPPVQKAAGLSHPIRPQAKNPFDGPLPFEKLDWRTSIFEKKPTAGRTAQQSRRHETTQVVAGFPSFAPPSAEAQAAATAAAIAAANAAETGELEPDSDDELAGGFERQQSHESSADAVDEILADEELDGGFEKDPALADESAPRPLPPWMVDNTDIRAAVRQQQQYDEEINAEDREMALEEAKIWQRQQKEVPRFVELDSSSDGGSDIEVLDAPPSAPEPREHARPIDREEGASAESNVLPTAAVEPIPDNTLSEVEDQQHERAATDVQPSEAARSRSSSPEMDFEDVDIPEQPVVAEEKPTAEPAINLTVSDSPRPAGKPADKLDDDNDDGLFTGDVGDAGGAADDDAAFDFSDPEDEELLAQMAEEAEEHARFASTLNHRTAEENQRAYEQELKALRSQQKKDRRDADEVTQIMVAECQALLRLFGIPYVTAPMEAEAQCAELVALGLVDGIVTDDSDTFLFGGTRVYKNVFNGNKFVECYLAADLERELSLSRETLIAVAQLLGSDYTDGLPGVGPVTAMEILSEFPGPHGLEAFRAWWDDVQTHNRPREADAGSPFRRKFRKGQATKLFLPLTFPNPAVADAYLHPDVDRSTEPFQWGVPDLDGLRTFLMATIGWGPERTDEVLVPVIRDMNRREVEGTQSNITRFFTGGVGAGVRLTEAQALAQQQQQQQQQQIAGMPDEIAPRHAPRARTNASSRRMAAAVSRLKATTTAAEAAASVMRASGGTTTPAAGRKRKGHARARDEAMDDEADHSDDLVDGEATATTSGESHEADDVPARRRSAPTRRTGKKKTKAL
ncbi:DNA excision repair protein rad2 [Niveomyces insectorum RCEF 264]|uniref:DNA excision repair protein rad2 n=1 Tax=Niveomyces insectorum RCEF 264 TaxID=1081102 RepID=A0A167Y8Y2_9HYPO|nr:DNA excision repair protein rad2 [Niveomyces insectorum RCEF 264]